MVAWTEQDDDAEQVPEIINVDTLIIYTRKMTKQQEND